MGCCALQADSRLFGNAHIIVSPSRKIHHRRLSPATARYTDSSDNIRIGPEADANRGLFHPLVESLLTRDDYMLLADYQAYVDCQQRVSEAYSDHNNWTRMSILNTAPVGRFSSDRSIREYCREIWKIQPIVSVRQ